MVHNAIVIKSMWFGRNSDPHTTPKAQGLRIKTMLQRAPTGQPQLISSRKIGPYQVGLVIPCRRLQLGSPTRQQFCHQLVITCSPCYLANPLLGPLGTAPPWMRSTSPIRIAAGPQHVAAVGRPAFQQRLRSCSKQLRECRVACGILSTL